MSILHFLDRIKNRQDAQEEISVSKDSKKTELLNDSAEQIIYDYRNRRF